MLKPSPHDIGNAHIRLLALAPLNQWELPVQSGTN